MKRWIILAFVLTILAFASSLLVYANRTTWLPEQVPTHWGISGEPDAWVARDQMLFTILLVPIMMVVMVLVGMVIPWLSPVHFKIEPFQATYEYIMGMIVAMFAYMHTVILLAYTQTLTDTTRWIVGGTFLFIAVLGNVLGKVKRNFYVGVRTPWTLASDTVWIRTHRLAAWMFVIGGLLGFVLVMIGFSGLIALPVFGLCALVPVIYSLVLYKRLEKEGKLNGEAT